MEIFDKVLSYNTIITMDTIINEMPFSDDLQITVKELIDGILNDYTDYYGFIGIDTYSLSAITSGIPYFEYKQGKIKEPNTYDNNPIHNLNYYDCIAKHIIVKRKNNRMDLFIRAEKRL